jgi:hypothetical protein
MIYSTGMVTLNALYSKSSLVLKYKARVKFANKDKTATLTST